jgi:hypothetical protein
MLDGPIISSDSPLRRIPNGLNHRQRLFVDGIRYSIEMSDVAYTRLCVAVAAITPDGALPSGVGFAHVFLDAWSIVDSIHRLRQLVGGMPRFSNSPAKELFTRGTAGVEDLRHAVQHLLGEFTKDANDDDLPWGSLRWVAGPYEGTLKLRLMIAGTATSTSRDFVNPAGRAFQPPVDHVVLDAHGHSLDLSATMRSVVTFAAGFERGWDNAITSMPPSGPADVMISADFVEDLISEQLGEQ